MSNSKTTWRKELTKALGRCDETFADIVSITLSETELDEPFDDGYGSTNGKPFTVWTANRVYFPACYDGAEWVSSVSRNPDGIPTNHIGE